MREIEVEGIAPPISVRLVGLFYFTAILVLGLVVGLWLQRVAGRKPSDSIALLLVI